MSHKMFVGPYGFPVGPYTIDHAAPFPALESGLDYRYDLPRYARTWLWRACAWYSAQHASPHDLHDFDFGRTAASGLKKLNDQMIVARLADGEDPYKIDPEHGCTNPLTGYYPQAEVDEELRRRARMST